MTLWNQESLLKFLLFTTAAFSGKSGQEKNQDVHRAADGGASECSTCHEMAAQGTETCLTCHEQEQPKPGMNVPGTYCNQCHWLLAGI